jgi:hypothetical protein
MSHEEVLERLKQLSDREKKALEEASTAIYFTDSSDYLSGLWGVVSALLEIPSDVYFDDEDNAKLASYLINHKTKM